MKLKKIELSIPIDEKELVFYLLGRYSLEQLDTMGIQVENSILRNFMINPDGKCVFRVCSMVYEGSEKSLENIDPKNNLVRVKKK